MKNILKNKIHTKLYLLLKIIIVMIFSLNIQSAQVQMTVLSTVGSEIVNPSLSDFGIDLNSGTIGKSVFQINLFSSEEKKELEISLNGNFEFEAEGKRHSFSISGNTNKFDLDANMSVSVSSSDFLNKNGFALFRLQDIDQNIDNDTKSIILSGGTIPPGLVTISFELKDSFGSGLATGNLQYKISQIGATSFFQLFNPGIELDSGDPLEITSPFPTFNWIYTTTSSVRYEFILKRQLREGEGFNEAQVHHTSFVDGTSFVYPADASILESGLYYWQVIAHIQGTTNTQKVESPIFVFKYKDLSNIQPITQEVISYLQQLNRLLEIKGLPLIQIDNTFEYRFSCQSSIDNNIISLAQLIELVTKAENNQINILDIN